MLRYFLCLLVLAALSARCQAQGTEPRYRSNHLTIAELLSQPETELDLANIKVAIDHMVDPSIDRAAVLKQIEKIASEVEASFPLAASNLQKFKALRDYLHRPPRLSGRMALRYNLEDDRNPKAKLLSVYLATGRGNCVSMPVLLVAIGQRLGLPLTLATAPQHLYAKLLGDDGNWYGIEATSGGGWADDDWQKAQFPTITEKAIANGIYLQPLSRREAAATLAEALLETYENDKSIAADRARINLALLILHHYPKNVTAMAHAYFGYLGLRQRLFVDNYPRPADIPPTLRGEFEYVERSWAYWGNKVKALGYQPPTPAMEEAYRERLRQARAALSEHQPGRRE